jgi:hypothetical protein
LEYFAFKSLFDNIYAAPEPSSSFNSPVFNILRWS